MLVRLTKINIQANVDDIAVFCPSSMGFRLFLKELELPRLKHSLAVKKVKTKTMISYKQGFNKFVQSSS